jgi:hypothetical protein
MVPRTSEARPLKVALRAHPLARVDLLVALALAVPADAFIVLSVGPGGQLT